MVLLGQADALHIPLPDESVQCVITSPPYWGLRSYQAGPGEIGLEQSPDEYVAALVAAFREIWRVLRKDGTVWLNLGDSYVGSSRGNKPGNHSTSSLTNPKRQDGIDHGSVKRFPVLKPKDLCMIPARVALALQADGWYLRSDIIWAKGVSFCPTYSGSVMPESVRDRPTQSYEHVFLLAKSKRYFYDAEAVKEPLALPDTADGTRVFGGKNKHGANLSHARTTGGTYDKAPSGRNLRSVWTINPKPSKLAHYAAFPPALVEPMVLAGTSAKGCCPECGAQWRRVVERTKHPKRDMEAQRAETAARTGRSDGHIAGPSGMVDAVITTGWRPTCTCGTELAPVPAIVLDPFGGTMTVGEVCRKHGRHFIGLDLKREYVEMGRERLSLDKMAAWNEAPTDGEGEPLGDLPLFRAEQEG